MTPISRDLLSLSPIAALDAFGLPFVLFRSRDSAILPSDTVVRMLDATELEDLRDRLAVTFEIDRPIKCTTSDVHDVAPWRSYRLRARSVSTADGCIIAVLLSNITGAESAAAMAASALTSREQSVARLIARGQSNKHIAATLTISEHTARHHTERVFAKLGVRTRAAVAGMMAGSAE